MTREEAKQKLWATGSINTMSKVECDNILNEVYDDFENRTCESCKYWQYENAEALAETCRFGNIEHSYQADSFGCNKWGQK